MAGESALAHLSQRIFQVPAVVCRLNPQRLGAVALAFQVYLDLHFLLRFVGEPSNLNLNSKIETKEAKTSRPPRLGSLRTSHLQEAEQVSRQQRPV